MAARRSSLQHLRLLSLPGLSLTSRLTFMVGALAYLSAPAWILFVFLLSLRVEPPSVGAGMTNAAGSRGLLSIVLLAATLMFLFLPKSLALIRLARRSGGLRQLGGCRPVLLSLAGESLFGMLFTPIQLVLRTQFVVAILLRRAA